MNAVGRNLAVVVNQGVKENKFKEADEAFRRAYSKSAIRYVGRKAGPKISVIRCEGTCSVCCDSLARWRGSASAGAGTSNAGIA